MRTQLIVLIAASSIATLFLLGSLNMHLFPQSVPWLVVLWVGFGFLYCRVRAHLNHGGRRWTAVAYLLFSSLAYMFVASLGFLAILESLTTSDAPVAFLQLYALMLAVIVWVLGNVVGLHLIYGSSSHTDHAAAP
jgi:hypothetical protein